MSDALRKRAYEQSLKGFTVGTVADLMRTARRDALEEALAVVRSASFDAENPSAPAGWLRSPREVVTELRSLAGAEEGR